MHVHPFDISPISSRIWRDKYQFRTQDGAPVDKSVEDSWRRLARAAASAEGAPVAAKRQEQAFFDAMSDFVFLPAGRILAGAGTDRDVTLFNCFVMGTIEDDLNSIFDHVREAALTMQKGGGIGHDFSTLRPKGAMVSGIGADASGPVSFMNVWDSMCQTIMSAGARRGAMMGTLRVDHPDIETFIAAKSDPARLRNFNLSVLVPDSFVAAVRNDREWELAFGGKVYRTVRARELWEQITQATYNYAEPGVIFIDRVNAKNNLSYCETIETTNPCGEQPLPPYGACLLGSINLARLVERPFSEHAAINLGELEEHVRSAIRFLDNIIDVSRYPLAAQEHEAKAKRRIGLGITGLADALIFLGLRYDSDTARSQAGAWMSAIQNAAYMASAELAAERGSFPLYDAERFLAGDNVQALEETTRAALATHGIRNGCLTSIAPTGTISLLAGNVSSGIEPVFAIDYERRVLEPDGSHRVETVSDYAASVFRSLHPESPLPATFETAAELSVGAHVKMQGTVQPYVDSSISKTINCPADISFEDFQNVYLDAFYLGLKGCTTFRPNDVTGAVISGFSEAQAPFESAPAASVVPQPSAPPDVSSSQVVFMTEPLKRAEALDGKTYKLKWPGSAHAMYITINDIDRDGRRVPFEIFINTKNLEHQAWTVALTRMISAVFRRGGDVSFVVEELKAIFDPQGGQWVQGKYVPSLIAAIGDIIERHMIGIGFLERQEVAAPPFQGVGKALGGHASALRKSKMQIAPVGQGRQCPRCGMGRLLRIEGCWSCPDCGYSQCG